VPVATITSPHFFDVAWIAERISCGEFATISMPCGASAAMNLGSAAAFFTASGSGATRGIGLAVAQALVCVPDKYAEAPVRVAAMDAEGNLGPWSDPLVLERVHDFDADGDGVVGWSDFGMFSQQAMRCYHPNGTIGGCE